MSENTHETDPATQAWLDVKAKLADAEAKIADHAKTTAASEKVLADLKARVVKAEVAARRPVDAEAVEALIANRIRMTDDGDFIALDAAGDPLVGEGPGFGPVSLGDYLDKMQKTRTALFVQEEKQTSTSSRSSSRVEFNPHAPGFNLTEATLAAKRDPEAMRALLESLAPLKMTVGRY